MRKKRRSKKAKGRLPKCNMILRIVDQLKKLLQINVAGSMSRLRRYPIDLSLYLNCSHSILL